MEEMRKIKLDNDGNMSSQWPIIELRLKTQLAAPVFSLQNWVCHYIRKFPPWLE